MKRFLGFITVIILVVIGLNFTSAFKDVKGNSIQVEKMTFSKKVLNRENELVLVNKQVSLNNNYSLDDLREVNIRFIKTSKGNEKLLKNEAATAIENLFEAAKRDGIILYGNSGYRSLEEQRNLYKKKEKTKGQEYTAKYVAKPGNSEHQTGLAMDVTNEGRNFYEGSKEAKWIEKNAYKYGFIVRYLRGKENITGYNYEPWHIRYVGTKASKIIYNKGITLEEYLQEE